jgi:predicted phosphoribosyltransferase
MGNLPNRFTDRFDAGRQLADALSSYANQADVTVLALPRGGVPVAAEVARRLAAPLDVLVVRKLGVPDQPELAMGAIADGGVRILHDGLMAQLNLAPEALDRITRRETVELARRVALYRGSRPPAPLAGRTVILVDDGLATGATMEAAVQAVRTQRPARIVVAVPVGAADTCDRIRRQVDDLICLIAPAEFYAVGAWYDDFRQTTDAEVRALLAGAG